MIDHISIGVSDLKKSTVFYERVLKEIDIKKLVERPATVGFGKSYPEFWLNLRQNQNEYQSNIAFHVCLRAKSVEAVNAFFSVAMNNGATTDGDRPGLRPDYSNSYFAAFIKDLDGNRIEAVTFVQHKIS